jgi:adenylosuccinate synthase
MLSAGKINILIDGQFGSTGKGLMAGYIASRHPIDIAISNASANAGHTCVGVPGYGVTPVVLYHLPMSHLFQRDSLIYLCAGSVIDPDILFREIEKYDINTGKLLIHPRAAVIDDRHKILEDSPYSQATKIGSTRHGVGAALAAKANRTCVLAGDHPKLKSLVGEYDLRFRMITGSTVFMEVPQGFSLGINSGLAYPYCTSREISIPQALSDAQIHPSFLGQVTMTVRTFPIRVGNIYDGDKIVGWSGPWYEDQYELSWDAIGVPSELTTVTKRPRRVATFSMFQYELAVQAIRPDYVFLNFCNYLKPDEFHTLRRSIDDIQKPTHLGFGPHVDQIIEAT